MLDTECLPIRLQITLPVRFMLLICHFIAVLTVVFGLEELSSGITGVDPSSKTVTSDQLDDFDNTKNT